MNRNSKKCLAVCALGALIAGVLPATADEVLVYKVASARRWQQDTAYYPNSADPQLRNSIVGTFKDTSYLILNRTTKEMAVINYYQFVQDGGKYKVYKIERGEYADWNGTFPVDTRYEYQVVQAPKANTQVVSLKSGFQTNEATDFNDDGFSDTSTSGEMLFLRGAGGARKLSSVITLQEVGSKLAGLKREFNTIEYGPAGTPAAYGTSYYRGGGNLTATLDASTTLAATTLPGDSTEGAITMVEDLLKKIGYDNIDAP